ncbi:hypothetical protein [Bosea sp. RAC05]|uniref:hypothetical protein n=1 Tax=Bosea sp. RAC05 TaxID=1842539 RepID=UPI000858B306|nr:hypothetical protein [Bosea sp. RAC05]AOG03267.1 hypothetical protein BSY19_5127 [Bosea sp. RAC05]
MRLVIDVSRPLEKAGYNETGVLAAMLQFYIARAHGDEAFPVPDAMIFPRTDSIAAIGDRLLGKAGDHNADFSFDVHEAPSQQGVTTPVLYHAQAVIYAWHEYNWYIEEATDGLSCDQAVGEAVDEQALGFDISPLDWMTKKGISERSLIVIGEQPSPSP